MSLRIVYMGTPDFAIPPLEAILNAGYTVAGVITAPDKPAGRGKKLAASPVKKFALEKGLKVLQPLKLKDPEFLEELKSWKPDLQVVVAFRMLPREVWSLPSRGSFNLHASLLPQYRGAAPINWALINGEKKTGLTTFFIDEKIDTGEIIGQTEMDIGEDETAGELHDRMMITGADLVVNTIKKIEEGRISPIRQSALLNSDELKPAPKIFRDDCRINWNQDAQVIHNFIRGLSPYPAAWTEMTDGKSEPVHFKIFLSDFEPGDHPEANGTIISDQKTFIKVAVSNGYISIIELQQAGKKRLTSEEFLRGFNDINKYRFQS